MDGSLLYHEIKNMCCVMLHVGHKNIKNTILFIQLKKVLFQGVTNYISKVAKKEREIYT
jgi:hypothetical protein